MAKVVIFGTGRGANVAKRYIENDSKHKIVAFTADKKFIKTKKFNNLPLVDFNNLEKIFSPKSYKLFIPLGFDRMNAVRAKKYYEGKKKGFSFISYIHSKNILNEKINIGENCFILENNSINFDVKIGNNVTIWSGCQLGDESIIGDHVWLSSHATLSGQVKVGDYSFLGVNSTISNNIKIASQSYIGAAAFISKDTKKNGVYVQKNSELTFKDSDSFMDFFIKTKFK